MHRFYFVKSTKLYHYLIALTLSSMLLSCSSDDNTSEQPRTPADGIIQTYLEADSTLEATYLEDLNIYKIVIRESPANAPQIGQSIITTFLRIRNLETERVIDIRDSINGGPAKMLVGAGAIYPIGIDDALRTMRVGEKSRFFISPEKGYGNIEITGLIDLGAVLDVELDVVAVLSVEEQQEIEDLAISDFIENYDFDDDNSLDDDFRSLANGVKFRIISDPLDSGAFAGIGEEINIQYIGTFLNGSPFDRTQGTDVFTFRFGQGDVISGLEEGIAQMKKSERALVLIPSFMAYEASVQVMPPLLRQQLVEDTIIPEYATSIGPYQTLVFEVTLVN